jgi:dipeptidyl aminopeptidase/acylaminoacyl peptidase
VTQKQIAPYGSWKSPITSDLITSGTISLGSIRLDGQDVYWTEGRPAEAGRSVIVRRTPDGTTTDITPPPFNARTRVHEYGGAAYAPNHGTVYFSNFDDNRLYRCEAGQQPTAITAEGPWRYADFVVDAARNRLISVREDHSNPDAEAVNTLVSIDLGSGEQRVMVSGNNFYAAPRISPDGAKLSWLTWNHPNMPWDGSELWIGSLGADEAVSDAQQVAGGQTESIFQPEWSPDGTLYFASDRTGWWNIYRLRGESEAEILVKMEAEFGTPAWVFGMSTYAFQSADTIACIVGYGDQEGLGTIDTQSKTFHPVQTPYSELSDIQAQDAKVVFLGGSPSEPAVIVQMNTASGKSAVLKRASELSVDRGYISTPESIEFPTENGLTAHAFYYPPHNEDFQAPAGELPPLIVHSHGGPTGATSTSFSLSIQYWTSRGFAIADVNYGGSSGYGRAYRQRLNGQWGVVDVDDCVNAARYLVEKGLADPNRLIIVGGSAGGYTTLSALAFRDTFKAGASYFGLADLVPFVNDTHKFESRYLDGLIGPYPERADLYRERSAINYTDQLSCPIILFQGLDDKVVPPNQAELMVEALREKGLPYAYVTYEGEGHGFRKAENIKRTLDGELYFYSRIFGFDLAEPVEPVRIENLPQEAAR